MKNKKACPPTRRGSGLIFAVILLFVILGMVVTLSSITVLETKMSQKTKSSVGAFYNSESGVEWALNKIANAPAGTMISNSTLGFNDTNPGDGVGCVSGGGCNVFLLDQNGIVINTDVALSDIKAVRSVGTQNTGDVTQRAIEAAVAAGDTWCNVTDIQMSAAKTGNFGGYQGMYNWIQTNGCAGYHVCDGTEITCYYQTHATDSLSGWYISAFYSASGSGGNPAQDCHGFTNDNSGPPSYKAEYWSNSFPSDEPCSNTHSVMCCK